MKRVILLGIIFLMIAVSLAACFNNSFTDTDDKLDYETFRALLEVNRFSIDAEEQHAPGSFLTGQVFVVYIGDETLIVYEYDSHEAMLLESTRVGRTGHSISDPNDPFGPVLQITWMSNPYWFKRDYIIVRYVGTDRRIIDFLHEALELFAGTGYRGRTE